MSYYIVSDVCVVDGHITQASVREFSRSNAEVKNGPELATLIDVGDVLFCKDKNGPKFKISNMPNGDETIALSETRPGYGLERTIGDRP